MKEASHAREVASGQVKLAKVIPSILGLFKNKFNYDSLHFADEIITSPDEIATR